MRRTLTIGVAAITAAIGILGAGNASARDYYDRYGNRHHHRGDRGDAALAAGVVGLALGAALASGNDNRRGYYRDGYYRDRYYRDGYYDSGRYYAAPRYRGRAYYRDCRTIRTWDPYYGTVYQRQCW